VNGKERINDVSAWNERIDFKTLRQARRNLVGIYTRAAEWRQAGIGTDIYGQTENLNGGLMDPEAPFNLETAPHYGLLCGLYHRTYPSLNSGEQEAVEFTNWIRHFGAWGRGWLFPMIDVEEARDLNKWITEFFEAYADLSPTPYLMFYGSNSYFATHYKVATVIPSGLIYRVCVAHTEKWAPDPYKTNPEGWAGKAPLNNFPDKDIVALHQYSHTLTSPGIKTKHDGIAFVGGTQIQDVII
jgi:hypothetical protein